MKIYVFYTSGHEVLLHSWFMPSVPHGFKVIVNKGHEPRGIIVDYKKQDWFNLMKQKVEFVIKAINENWNELFIFSDSDVLFFSGFEEYLLKRYKNQDLLFQKNNNLGSLCAGFFLCKGNNRTLKFWRSVLNFIGKAKMDDQDVVNSLLHVRFRLFYNIFGKLSQKGINSYRIKWGYLPPQFATYGTIIMKQWEPGVSFKIPDDIALFHANWTSGLKNKIALLAYVREIVNARLK